MTWKNFQTKKIKLVIVTMYEQLKEDMDIIHDNKNKVLNVMRKPIQDMEVELTKEIELLKQFKL